jgi:hypothetical protein
MRLSGFSNFLKYALLKVAIGSFFVATIAFALDTVSQTIPTQSATSGGGNSNIVWFSTGTTSTGTQYYIQYMNKDNDSSTIQNYLRGYYYDTQFGFFKLDWNTLNTDENVHISASSDRCPTGYWYRFDGYAQGVDAGFLDFGYNDDIYVYYCESDNKLHGYAYSPDFGLQSFEGISFSVAATSTNNAFTPVSTDPFFVNNNSILLLPDNGSRTVQGDVTSSDWGKSTIFYIVK